MRIFEIAKDWEDKGVILPRRSSKYSAGYDFYCAEDTSIEPLFLHLIKNGIKTFLHFNNYSNIESCIFSPALVPTGVKSKFHDDEGLFLYNRSSNPIKRALLLSNGVGVIDADYYENPDNDGHIFFQFYNFSFRKITIKKGEKIGQGVFQKYYLTDDDEAEGIRTSGHGSTGL